MEVLTSRLRFLPFMLAMTAVLGAVGAVVALVVGGPVAAAGVAAGVALVAASFAVSSALLAWADAISPKLVFAVGLGTYALKFTVLFLALAVIAQQGWAGLKPMTVGIAVAAVGWTAGHGWWLWHARIPYVDLGR